MRSLLILISAAVTLSAANPTFLDPRSYPVAGMSNVVTGDFNGDGKLDMAVSGYTEAVTPVSTLQIMLGNGKGLFTALPSIAPGDGPLVLAAADFNGDGKLDLAVANWASNTVSILLGKGNGAFQSPLSFSVTQPIALAAGDINSDGHVDLVVGTFTGEQVLVFLGSGNGKFHQVSAISPGYSLSQVALADLNHDGKLDLIYSGSPGPGIVTQLGLGNGHFGPAATFGPNSIAFALADLNGDGNLDVAADYGGNIQIGLGNGDGTFSAGASIVLPFTAYGLLASGAFLTSGDFNEDGHQDLVIGLGNNNGPQNLAVLLGAGDGTFPTPSLLAEECPCSLATGDFNGDHHMDLAMGNLSAGSVSVALGNGHGSFPAPSTPTLASGPVRGIATGDFNKDGNMDLVTIASNNPGQLDVLSGNCNGTFQAPVSMRVGFLPTAVAVADLNHDGILDIVVTDSEKGLGGVWVLLGQPDGTFKKPVEYSIFSTYEVTLSIGDLNGDGFPDIMVIGSSSEHQNPGLYVLMGNGDGTFGFPSTAFAAGQFPLAMATGDFNGHGKLDAVVTDDDGGEVLLLAGNGDGSFAAPVTLAACTDPASVVTGDFNHDGHPDLAIACTQQNAVLVLLGAGNGSFQSPVSYAMGFPMGLAVADMNSDGIADLVVLTGNPAAFTVLTGKGDGSFQNGGSFDAMLAPVGILAADFNNHGKPDLAIFGGPQTANPAAVAVSVFTNTTR